MKARFVIFAVFVLFTLSAVVSPLRAASVAPELLGKFGHWTAYKMVESGQRVCYMSLTLRASKEKKEKLKRGDVMLMITHRPADNSTDVVSYTAGLKFKPSSEATITVGSKKYTLFTQGDTAWSRDVATDHALAKVIRSSANVTINGLTARDTAIADKLNLTGSYDAYVAINKACGMPVPEPMKPKKATPTKSAKAPKKTKP